MGGKKDSTGKPGIYNSVIYNSRICNSGYRNSGIYNSGICNSGHYNSGIYNSGNHNSGNCNSGNHNSGNRNSGNCNSGHYNSGNGNSGLFNTDAPKLRIFNKDTDKTIEDIDLPYVDLKVKGYVNDKLITRTYKEAWKLYWEEDSTEEERKQFLSLPNFCPKIFLEITGIDVAKPNCSGKIVEIDGEKYELRKLL